MKTKPKAKKKRAKQYEKKVKIYASFDDAMKTLVKEPKVTYKKARKKA